MQWLWVRSIRSGAWVDRFEGTHWRNGSTCGTKPRTAMRRSNLKSMWCCYVFLLRYITPSSAYTRRLWIPSSTHVQDGVWPRSSWGSVTATMTTSCWNAADTCSMSTSAKSWATHRNLEVLKGKFVFFLASLRKPSEWSAWQYYKSTRTFSCSTTGIDHPSSLHQRWSTSSQAAGRSLSASIALWSCAAKLTT